MNSMRAVCQKDLSTLELPMRRPRKLRLLNLASTAAATFRLVRDNLADPKGLPIGIRLLCDAHRLLLELDAARSTQEQPSPDHQPEGAEAKP